MSTRDRPVDIAVAEARQAAELAGREIRIARRLADMSHDVAAGRAGMSASQFGRIERGLNLRPTLEQLARAARAVGLAPTFRLFPGDVPVRDQAQLTVLARFEALLGPPLQMRREVPLPIRGDKRAWDARVTDGVASASAEAESRIHDCQALARRTELKARDDPRSGPVILVLNRTAHNRAVLAEHREALRGQFPLDGAAIARCLRAGKVPPASGIILI